MSAPSGRFFFCYIHGVTIFYIDVQKYIVTNAYFVTIFSQYPTLRLHIKSFLHEDY